MWIVYNFAPYEGYWNQKYFNKEDNARQYYEWLKEFTPCTDAEIEEIVTED